MMKNLISQFILILVLALSIFGQGDKPRLVDEFGQLHLDDVMARLDFLIIETQNAPNSKALIRVYGSGLTGDANHYSRADVIEAYLINMRKFPADRILIQTCSGEARLRTLLYVVPPNAAIKDCIDKLEVPKKTTLFTQIIYEFGENTIAPYKEIFIDYRPEYGNYSKRTFQKIKELLDRSNKHKVFVISYLGTNLETEFGEDENGQKTKDDVRYLDKKPIADKLLKMSAKELRKYGIKSSQIETKFGEYVDGKRRLEFWFVPEDGEIPKLKSDIQPEDEAILIDEFALLNAESLTARLDVFYIELQKHPDKVAYVITYSGEGASLGYPHRFLTKTQNFLNESYKEKLNVKFIYGGYRPSHQTRFWIASPNDLYFTDRPLLENVDLTKTIQFDSFLYATDNNYGCCRIDSYGIQERETSYTKYAQVLKDNPDLKAYVIYYGQYRVSEYSSEVYLDSKKTISNVIKTEEKTLNKKFGIAKDRLTVINGGYREWQEIELWLVPKDGEIPKSTPKTFPKKIK